MHRHVYLCCFIFCQPSRFAKWRKPTLITAGVVGLALALSGIAYGTYRTIKAYTDTEGGCKKRATQYFGCQFVMIEKYNRPSLQYLQQENLRPLIGYEKCAIYKFYIS